MIYLFFQIISLHTISYFFFIFFFFFFFSSRRRHTRSLCDWSSDVCSSDLLNLLKHRCSQSGQSWGHYLLLRAPVLQQVQSAFSWFRTTLHAPHHCTGNPMSVQIQSGASAPVVRKPALCGRWMALESK